MSYPVSRHKARQLMKEAGLKVKSRKRFKVTTDSNHAKPLFDNVLKRDFAPKGPNQAYVQDITYLWTQEGWLYLAIVLDLYSRAVVGWSMSSRMEAELATQALLSAVWRRKPKKTVLIHSDQGSQFTGYELWIQLVAATRYF